MKRARNGFRIVLPFCTSPTAVETKVAGNGQRGAFGAGFTSGKDLHDLD